MKRYAFLAAFLLAFAASSVHAQFYLSPNLGFKSYGLQGIGVLTEDGDSERSDRELDAGQTSFDFGTGLGVEIVHTPYYNFDLGLNVRMGWAKFIENAYNDDNGSGAFAEDGLTGAKTTIIGFDLMPVHRLTFPDFQLLSPFLAVGPSVNLLMTGDLEVPEEDYTVKGKTEVKFGLHVAWGCEFHATEILRPYFQIDHMVGFGDETKGVDDAGNSIAIEDTPGFFGMSAGLKFVF
jgi:opacity protein-like surface antigen